MSNKTKIAFGAVLMTFFTISGMKTVAQMSPNDYCVADFDDNGNYVSNVSIGSINNSSGGNLSSQDNDFTSRGSTMATAGQTVGIQVQSTRLPSSDEYYDVYVFCDWDHNGSMGDPGEVYALTTSNNTAGTTTTNYNIAVPVTAVGGTSILRVMVTSHPFADPAMPDPCMGAEPVDLTGEVEDYALEVVSVLPIGLAEIQVANAGARNRVEWSTVNEEDGDSFELERSADGSAFSTLAKIPAKGRPSVYTWWDKASVRGENYYRLRLVNSDGTRSYSRIVSAWVGEQEGDQVFSAGPNPVGSTLTIGITHKDGTSGTITLSDMKGQVLRRFATDASSLTIDMNGYAPGLYLISYRDNTRNETLKIYKR